MEAKELLSIVSSGENSTVQFKRTVTRHLASDITAEMVALSNTEGGLIIIGIDDKTGDIIGLNFKEIETINNLLFNWAANNVKPAINIFTETVILDQGKVIIAKIYKGINKPYCDNKMNYWVKSAANKRKAVPEELQRMFQAAGKLLAEERIIESSSIDDIDTDFFIDFYKERYKEEIDKNDLNLESLVQNLKLFENGKLNLAGALLFAKDAQNLIPEFYITAIWFWGNEFITDDYRGSDNIYGNIKTQYIKAFNFILSTLHKIQKNKSFNSLGDCEIPEIVIRELLVNALIHRDYFINDSIKVFVFENRIEIKSPGKLPDNLTVEDIKQGIQRRTRNIILTSFAFDILPYRGTGSGILKSLQAYPYIDFENNIEGEYFKVTIHRQKLEK